MTKIRKMIYDGTANKEDRNWFKSMDKAAEQLDDEKNRKSNFGFIQMESTQHNV